MDFDMRPAVTEWNPSGPNPASKADYKMGVSVPDAGVPSKFALFSPMSLFGSATAVLKDLPSIDDILARGELLISPESEAEHLVNQIYGFDANGNPLMPPGETIAYDPELQGALPHIIAAPINAVKKTLTDTASALGDVVTKYAIIAVAVLIAGVFIYAFVGAKARKLA